jgi:hypothetical protein
MFYLTSIIASGPRGRQEERCRGLLLMAGRDEKKNNKIRLKRKCKGKYACMY